MWVCRSRDRRRAWRLQRLELRCAHRAGESHLPARVCAEPICPEPRSSNRLSPSLPGLAAKLALRIGLALVRAAGERIPGHAGSHNCQCLTGRLVKMRREGIDGRGLSAQVRPGRVRVCAVLRPSRQARSGCTGPASSLAGSGSGRGCPIRRPASHVQHEVRASCRKSSGLSNLNQGPVTFIDRSNLNLSV